MPAARKPAEGAELDVFVAIAHPVRRRILELLAGEEHSVTTLVTPFSSEFTRSAISQHLKILLDSGLVEVRAQGREHRYRLKPENLNEIYRWIKQYEQFWTDRLSALEMFLNSTPSTGDDDAARDLH
jgi:DNA-binding transcriptional ArsR family regulator